MRTYLSPRSLALPRITVLRGVGRCATAENLRSVWDYRKTGLKIEEAKKVVFSALCAYPRQRSFRLTAVERRLRQEQMRRAETSRFLREQYRRREAAEEEAWAWYNNDKAALSLAEWLLAPTPTWDRPVLVLRLPGGGGFLHTVRNEVAIWSRDRKHYYPESTCVSYTSTWVPYEGDRRSVNHSCRGNWRAKVMAELGMSLMYPL